MEGFEGGEDCWVAVESREKRVDIRFFLARVLEVWGVPLLDGGLSPWPTASVPAVTVIHVRFQSVCPAMRMRTHPSMRPRTRVVGTSRTENPTKVQEIRLQIMKLGYR